MSRTHLSLAAVIVAAFASPAVAQNTPALIGVTGNWEALTLDAPTGGKVCYTMSVPKSIAPGNVARDPIFFIVSDWPGRKVKSEPQVAPGYLYKDGSIVTAQIGTDKFTFFTQNDATTGGAWIKDISDEQRLLDAMARGAQMVVTGTSTRGTVTRDTYSLTGFSAALAGIHKACNM